MPVEDFRWAMNCCSPGPARGRGLGFVATLLIRAPLMGMAGGLGYAALSVLPSLGGSADWVLYAGSIVFVAGVSIPVSWLLVLFASAVGLVVRRIPGSGDERESARRLCLALGFSIGVALDALVLNAAFPTAAGVQAGYLLAPISALWVYRYALQFDNAPEQRSALPWDDEW